MNTEKILGILLASLFLFFPIYGFLGPIIRNLIYDLRIKKIDNVFLKGPHLYIAGVNCWKDTDCTIPANKDGDPVAVWKPLLGNLSLEQPNPKNQPKLKDGWLQF